MPRVLIIIGLVTFGIVGFEARWKNARKCGLSMYPDAGEDPPPLGRIINGEDAREFEFPYQVGLWVKEEGAIFCGGALITHRWMVTAAHCLVIPGISTPDEFNDVYEIRIGEFHTNRASEKEKIRKGDKVIIHEQFDLIPPFDNDIALVRLNRRVGSAQGRIRPICRPVAGENYTGSTAIASGWGTINRNSFSPPDVLQYVPLVVISHAECSMFYNETYLTTSMVCAGDGLSNTERDACQGDSGGPLAVKTDGRFQLVGLVLGGFGCAQGYPGVYTRITDFLEWLDSNL